MREGYSTRAGFLVIVAVVVLGFLILLITLGLLVSKRQDGYAASVASGGLGNLPSPYLCTSF
ncbi:MAG: hypothetical protein ACOC38_04065 [Promethearchaeia archaeon]